MMSICFVLLTHSNGRQILRITETLNATFGNPSIACHHDFSQCKLQKEQFAPNVRFVEDFVPTRWGDISLVRATLRGLRVLYAGSGPDWFYLLSGSDYPIRRMRDVRADLEKAECDAFMRAIPVDHTRIPKRLPGPIQAGFDSPHYEYMAYDRYIARWFPVQGWRRSAHFRSPRLLAPFHPFSSHYRCFSGDQWFTANRKTAEYILQTDAEPLLRYFARRCPPDEAVLHTLVGNAGSLKLSPELKHYVAWDADCHPKVLDSGDLPKALSSGAHFARKFAPDSPVLNEIDRLLGIEAKSGRATML